MPWTYLDGHSESAFENGQIHAQIRVIYFENTGKYEMKIDSYSK